MEEGKRIIVALPLFFAAIMPLTVFVEVLSD